MNKTLVKATKLLLDCMYYGGLLICFTLPVSLRVIGKWYPTFDKYYIQMCILFFLTGLSCVYILKQLRKMFVTVIREDCFVKGNVTSLKKMAMASFFVSIVTTFRLFVIITPATLIIIIVFTIAGLFSIVLSQVFEQAVAYKLENDMTI